MPSATARPAASRWSGPESRRRLLAVILIIGAAVTVYANSFRGAFVFDDQGAILENPTLRKLWPPGEVLSPPIHGLPVTGRPLTNLTFAFNYALHGTDPAGYHAVNLALHVACGLLLFGLLRRTLEAPSLPVVLREHAVAIGASATLIWIVHPLQTAAVTYISQRTEVLGSAFLLLALYAFARATAAQQPRRWLGLSLLSCWLGIGAKEIVAVAPLLVLAYDHAVLRDTWRTRWRRRGWYYLGMIASWLPLGWLILSTENRGATWAADSGFTPWEYLRLQCQAVIRYLQLVVWPTPLVFDYGRNLPVPPLATVWPHAVLLLGLFGGTLWALSRRPLAALFGVGFFAVLAPTSSFVPIADAIFEHRMYLPSACVITALIVTVSLRAGVRWLWVFLPLLIALGMATVARNRDYHSALTLWADTVAKQPDNARARGNLGEALVSQGRVAEALPHLEAAYRLTPQLPLPPHNLANALDLVGRREEAIRYYREALRLQPKNHLARANLANALAETGAVEESIQLFEATVREVPEFADAHRGYARALLRSGRNGEAIAAFRRAAELRPDDADAYFNLGDALARSRELPDAISAFREAVRLRPDHVPALNNLGNALLLTRQIPEAIGSFEQALRLSPTAATHTNLGLALLLSRRREDARAQFEAALKLDPNYAPARNAVERLRSAP